MDYKYYIIYYYQWKKYNEYMIGIIYCVVYYVLLLLLHILRTVILYVCVHNVPQNFWPVKKNNNIKNETRGNTVYRTVLILIII